MWEKMAKEEQAKANAQEGRVPDQKSQQQQQQQEQVTRDMQQKMYDNKIQRRW